MVASKVSAMRPRASGDSTVWTASQVVEGATLHEHRASPLSKCGVAADVGPSSKTQEGSPIVPANKTVSLKHFKCAFSSGMAKVPAKHLPRWMNLCRLVCFAAVIFLADRLVLDRPWPTVLGKESRSTFDVELAVMCLVGFLCHDFVQWRGQSAEIHNKYTSSHQGLARQPRVVPANEADQSQKRTANPEVQSLRRHTSQHHLSALATSRWNQAIHHAAGRGDFEKAVSLLLECEKSGDQPDAVSYNLIIHQCATDGDWQGAEIWLKRMESRGIQVTTCSYNALLDACAKANNVAACEMWLQRMISQGVEANVYSYASAIYACARRGDSAAAEGWFRKMLAAGVEPDEVSYNSIIHACGVRGNAEGAEKWVEEMRTRGLEATATTYTALIDACAKCGDIHRAEKWMSRMASEDVKANVITYSTMINTCAKAGDQTRAEYWHNKMVDSGVAPNAHSYSAVINACARAGDVAAAERWLEQLEKSGVHGDSVVYNTVLDACAKACDAMRAKAVFQRMRANGIRPEIVTYAALARPFAYRGEWIQVENIAATMRADGVDPNEYFVYAQLLAYGHRQRQPARAERYFRDMLHQGINKANDYIVSALANSVGHARCSELMKELCSGPEVPVLPHRTGGRQRKALASQPRDFKFSERW